MNAKKILFITSEITPFVPETSAANMGRKLPQAIQENGHEIRIFTPKWGNINERRNQLHEVIRLSGMNIIIDETDHPLIIKVASIAAARMQIYFIDNDDYFTKRQILCDENMKEYKDNGERMIFYVRGVLETLKKLRWVPDVIHCHGWASAFAPLYIKKVYMDEPSFCDAKVVFSASSPVFNNELDPNTKNCLAHRKVAATEVDDICADKFGFNELMKVAVKYSDGLILDDDNVDASVIEYAKSLNLPVLEYQGEDYAQAYSDFYDSVM